MRKRSSSPRRSSGTNNGWRSRWAGEPLVVTWEPGVGSPLDSADVGDGRDVGQADVRDANGERVAFDVPFWFAVAAFSPDVRIID